MSVYQHPKDPLKAYLYAGLAVLFWSTAASAFKLTLEHINFIQILFFATLTSCITLFIILLIQKNLYLLRTTTREEFIRSAFLGLLNPFLYYLILLKAYSLIPAQVAQPLNFTWPIMLVLLSVPLLNQRISVFSLGTMFLSFAGVYLISSQGNPFDMRFTDSLGVSLALVSSVLWALFWIYNVRDKRNEVVKLFLSFLFALIFVMAAMFFSSGFESLNWFGVAGGIYIGLFEMGITFIFWLKALQYAVSTYRVNNLIYVTPFFSLVLISLIVGERIHLTTIGGLLLIVTGIVLQRVVSPGQ